MAVLAMRQPADNGKEFARVRDLAREHRLR